MDLQRFYTRAADIRRSAAMALAGLSTPRATSRPARSRGESLIAAGRVVLAAVSILTFWLEDTDWRLRLTVLAYGVHAITLLVLGLLPHSQARRWTVNALVIDLAMFTLVLVFAEGPTSPVLVYFVFSLVYATLHWGWRGTLWTTAAAMSVFVVFGIDSARDATFDLPRFAVQGVYMISVASLVGYLGAHDERAHRDMASLAGWSPMAAGEQHALLRDVLARGAGVLRTPCLVAIWEQPDEPSTNVAIWRAGTFIWTREPSTAFQSFLGAAPTPATDRSQKATASARGLQQEQIRTGGWLHGPLPPLLVKRLSATVASSWSIRGQGIAGRLLCLDRPRLALDDMALGAVAGRLVTATLEHFHLLARLRQAVASEEQIRLARNLHDSVLQSLASVAMQLHTARQLFESKPLAASAQLQEAQETLADEQRRLRRFIASLRPFPTSDRTFEGGLAPGLEDLCQRVERQWGLEASLRVSGADSAAIAPIQQDILRLVNEALMNAARHAQASLVTVDLAVQASHVRIEVIDDGQGFPFTGEYDLASLNEMGVGPHSLKERVREMGGHLVLDSSPQGVRLVITLPLEPSRQSPHSSERSQEDGPMSAPGQRAPKADRMV